MKRISYKIKGKWKREIEKRNQDSQTEKKKLSSSPSSLATSLKPKNLKRKIEKEIKNILNLSLQPLKSKKINIKPINPQTIKSKPLSLRLDFKSASKHCSIFKQCF